MHGLPLLRPHQPSLTIAVPSGPPHHHHLLPALLRHHHYRNGRAWRLAASSAAANNGKILTEKMRREGKAESRERKVASALLKQLGMEGEALRKCLTHEHALTEAELMKLMATLRSVGMKRADLRSLLLMRPSLITLNAARVERVFRRFSDLGFSNSRVVRMWLRWPSLIDSDVENVVDMIHRLDSMGAQREDVLAIVSRRPQIVQQDSRRLALTISALHNAGISQAEMVALLKRVPDMFTASVEEVHASLSFWSSVNVKGKGLYKALMRRPNLLNYDIEKMSVSHQLLQRWMKPDDLNRLLGKYAEVLSFDSKKKLEPLIMYLLALGVKDQVIGKVIARRPQLLACTILGLEKTVNYLKILGVRDGMIGKIVTMSPQVLTLNSEEKLKQGVEFLRSVGLNKEKDMASFFLRNAQILCCSIEKNLQLKIEFLLKIGLSKESITNMIVRFPSMLGHSIDNSLGPKYVYLVNVMNRPVQELSDFPQYFGYSLEGRIKRRHNILQKNGIQISLASMLTCTNDNFHKRYVMRSLSNLIEQRTK